MQSAILSEEKFKFAAVQNVCRDLSKSLYDRMVKVEKNEILRLSMLIDPRFAYLEDFLPKAEWESLEGKFIDFLLKGV